MNNAAGAIIAFSAALAAYFVVSIIANYIHFKKLTPEQRKREAEALDRDSRDSLY